MRAPHRAVATSAVRVVSEGFRDQPRLQRHRSVYAALAPHMGGAIHALALETLTPDEV